ncbi:SdrD B-like domain-containing protein [Lentzea sp. NPDC051213]|uniref:SdrD B-like domain-containing protein n=1 Tax=Lentzea sp. NPDC051213 TaxID=3364126 RepID=UPI0037A1A199
MKNVFAVTMTAALVLAATGAPAAAQEDKIFIGGLVWLDRNGDGKVGDEPGLAGEKAVKITKFDGGELVGEYTTDDKGMYVARDLPAGKYRVSVSGERYTPTTQRNVVTEGGTVDFGLQGRGIAGRSFLDKNRDGVRQADEELLSPGTLNGKPIPVSREDGQFSVEDLPFGKYKFVAADYSQRGLALVKPLGTNPIDWVTGTLEFTIGELEGPAPLDAMYFEPKADAAVEDVTIAPAKDTYTVGEQIDVKFKLANKGDVPGKLSVIMFNFGSVKLVSLSDNVAGSKDDFETVAAVLPGESVTVDLKVEITGTDLAEIWPWARPFVGPFKDVDRKNQGTQSKKTIKVVEKGASAPTTSPTETTAPTTTTTPPAVVKAGNNSGLATTGAPVLGFLALGALLLTAGASAFLVARRRRS